MSQETIDELNKVKAYVQAMREDGDTDLRNIIGHIEYRIKSQTKTV